MAGPLIEIAAFAVAVAAAIGIGYALAAARRHRRLRAAEIGHRRAVQELQMLQRSQSAIETRAEARSAAEAAVRADLEGRLLEADEEAAQYRARAEAAERRLRAMPVDGVARNGADPAGAHPSSEVSSGEEPSEAERLRAALQEAEAARASAMAERDAGRDEIPARPGNGALAGPFLMPDARDRPVGLDAPRHGQGDDLRRIRGIGPRNASALNALGLYHFDQIASLTAENVAWLDAYFRAYGRIARDDWVGQAKALLQVRAAVSDKVHPDDADL